MPLRQLTYLTLAISAAIGGCRYEASAEYSAGGGAHASSGGERPAKRVAAKPKPTKKKASKAAPKADAKAASKVDSKAKAKAKVRTSPASGTKHSAAIRPAKKPPAPVGLEGSVTGRLALANQLQQKGQAKVKASADARAEAAGRDDGQAGAEREKYELGRKPDQVGDGGDGSDSGRGKVARKPTAVGQDGAPAAAPGVAGKPGAMGGEDGSTASGSAAHGKPVEIAPPPEHPPVNEFGYEQPVLGCFEGHVYFVTKGVKQLPVRFERAKAKSVLYACEWDIPKREWKRGFPGIEDRVEWFAIRYSGAFRVEEGGEYDFRLSSDDGAKLYIDGELVIDNDGIHPPKQKKGKVTLTPGDHHLVLEYFQGPRYMINLQLFVTPPGGEEGLFSVRD